MSLTQEQIKKIAERLSKIPNPSAKIGGDLNSILNYFELLKEVDTKDIKPTYSVIEKGKINILREDIETIKETNPEELLACSAQKVIGQQIAVANIMN